MVTLRRRRKRYLQRTPPPPQVHLSRQGPEVRPKVRESRMCTTKSCPGQGVVPSTAGPSFSGLQPLLRCSDKVLAVCSLFLEDKCLLWVVPFPSLSMRLWGDAHFLGASGFSSLIARLKDTVVSWEYPHFCQACYRLRSLMNFVLLLHHCKVAH